MALVTTPDGRSVYVPDYLAPPPDLTPPAPQMPPEPGYVPLGPDGYPQADDDPTRGQGGGAPPMGQGFPGAGGAMPWDPGALNRGKPPPKPRDDSARIGPMGFNDGQELAGPQGVPSVTGGAMPNVRDQLAPIGTTAPQPQPSRDFVAGVVDNDPKVIAAKEKAYARTQAAQAAQSRAQAAFSASPEGKAQAAGEGAAQAVEDRGQIAELGGELEGQELDAISALKNEGLDNSKRIADEQAARVEESKKATAAKVSEFERLTKAELEYKVDDNRRWKQMGTGKTMLFWISTALSGLGEVLARKPIGQLMPLKMMEQAIQQDVDAQIRDHETLGKRAGFARSSIETYRQATGDLQEARKLKIAEEYDRTAREIEAVSSKYASPKAKLRAQDMSAQFRQQAQALRGASAEGIIQRDVTRAQLANQRQQTAQGWSGLKLQRDKFDYDKKHDADVLQLEAAKLDQSGKGQQAEFVRTHGIGGTTVAILDEGGQPIIGPDGQPATRQDVIVAPYASKEKLTELQNQKAAADQIVALMDESIRLRDTYGWSSNLAQSPEWQKMRGNWAALKLELKDLAKLGVIAGPDEKLMNDFLGASDPTQARDPLAGMQNARDKIVNKYNSSLQAVGAVGADGRPFKYAPPQVRGAAHNSAEDADFRESLKPIPLAFKMGGVQEDIERQPSYGSPYTTDMEAVQRFNAEGTTKAQRKVIQSLADRAAGVPGADGKPVSQSQRDAARAMLAQGATDRTADEAVKRAYQGVLDSLNAPKGSPEETSGAVR